MLTYSSSSPTYRYATLTAEKKTTNLRTIISPSSPQFAAASLSPSSPMYSPSSPAFGVNSVSPASPLYSPTASDALIRRKAQLILLRARNIPRARLSGVHRARPDRHRLISRLLAFRLVLQSTAQPPQASPRPPQLLPSDRHFFSSPRRGVFAASFRALSLGLGLGVGVKGKACTRSSLFLVLFVSISILN